MRFLFFFLIESSDFYIIFCNVFLGFFCASFAWRSYCERLWHQDSVWICNERCFLDGSKHNIERSSCFKWVRKYGITVHYIYLFEIIFIHLFDIFFHYWFYYFKSNIVNCNTNLLMWDCFNTYLSCISQLKATPYQHLSSDY